MLNNPIFLMKKLIHKWTFRREPNGLVWNSSIGKFSEEKTHYSKFLIIGKISKISNAQNFRFTIDQVKLSKMQQFLWFTWLQLTNTIIALNLSSNNLCTVHV